MSSLNRRYFLTGCTGFVGRELVRQLGRQPDTEVIYCLTRSAQARYDMYSWPKVMLYEGDITSTTFPTGWNITDLIHGANEANDLRQPDLPRYYYTIVEGTNRILDWAQGEPSIKRRLLLSSGAAGRDTTYGRAKRMCEWLTERWGGNCTIARIYSVIGEEMPLNGQYAAGQFVHQALHDGEVRYWGGDAQRSYLHVSDVATWLRAILDYGTPLLPYEVGGDESVTMEELAQRIGATFGVPVRQIPGAPRPPDCYVPDLRRARSLGLRTTIPLSTALERIRDHLC